MDVFRILPPVSSVTTGHVPAKQMVPFWHLLMSPGKGDLSLTNLCTTNQKLKILCIPIPNVLGLLCRWIYLFGDLGFIESVKNYLACEFMFHTLKSLVMKWNGDFSKEYISLSGYLPTYRIMLMFISCRKTFMPLHKSLGMCVMEWF